MDKAGKRRPKLLANQWLIGHLEYGVHMGSPCLGEKSTLSSPVILMDVGAQCWDSPLELLNLFQTLKFPEMRGG